MLKALTYIILTLALSLSLAACSAIYSSDPTPGFLHINPQQARELISENNDNNGFIILDVRTSGEYSQGFIAGAINIDVQSPGYLDSLADFDKSAVYLVYCRSGNRSVTAGNLMLQNGFTTVYNMTGGINEWVSLEYPVTE